MRAVEKIIAEAKRLPAAERRRVVRALQPRKRKKAAPRGDRKSSGEGPYASWLRFSGTGHSDHTDLSTDKYKHLDVKE